MTEVNYTVNKDKYIKSKHCLDCVYFEGYYRECSCPGHEVATGHICHKFNQYICDTNKKKYIEPEQLF